MQMNVQRGDLVTYKWFMNINANNVDLSVLIMYSAISPSHHLTMDRYLFSFKILIYHNFVGQTPVHNNTVGQHIMSGLGWIHVSIAHCCCQFVLSVCYGCFSTQRIWILFGNIVSSITYNL